MTENRAAIAYFVGSLAIYLGFSSLLDDMVQGLVNILGTPQPVVRQRERPSVSRFDRMCFVVAGSAVILLALFSAFWGK